MRLFIPLEPVQQLGHRLVLPFLSTVVRSMSVKTTFPCLGGLASKTCNITTEYKRVVGWVTDLMSPNINFMSFQKSLPNLYRQK